MVLLVVLVLRLATQGLRDLIVMQMIVSGSPSMVIIATDPTSADPALVYYDLTGALLQRVTNPNFGVPDPNVRPYGIHAA